MIMLSSSVQGEIIARGLVSLSGVRILGTELCGTDHLHTYLPLSSMRGLP